MNSVALLLFHKLCDVATLLDQWRDAHTPGSDAWCAMTDIACALNDAITLLVHSQGLGGTDDDPT